MEVRFEPLTEENELIELSKFRIYAKSGIFRDADGFARLATNEQISNIAIAPSRVVQQEAIDAVFTHVVWFDKK